MLTNILIAWCLMAACVTVHAAGLTVAFRWMKRRAAPVEGRLWPAIRILIATAGWTLLIHMIQITGWAIAYTVLGGMPDLMSALYFSAVTYTTTGYGDLVLTEEWRLVGAVEALTGILMCGLSTGLFFAVFTRVFRIGQDGTQAP